jgi:hypothetical protein
MSSRPDHATGSLIRYFNNIRRPGPGCQPLKRDFPSPRSSATGDHCRKNHPRTTPGPPGGEWMAIVRQSIRSDLYKCIAAVSTRSSNFTQRRMEGNPFTRFFILYWPVIGFRDLFAGVSACADLHMDHADSMSVVRYLFDYITIIFILNIWPAMCLSIMATMAENAPGTRPTYKA